MKKTPGRYYGVTVFVIKLVAPSELRVTVKVTLYELNLKKICSGGFCTVDVVVSPKSQSQDVGFSVVLSVNVTLPLLPFLLMSKFAVNGANVGVVVIPVVTVVVGWVVTVVVVSTFLVAVKHAGSVFLSGFSTVTSHMSFADQPWWGILKSHVICVEDTTTTLSAETVWVPILNVTNAPDWKLDPVIKTL